MAIIGTDIHRAIALLEKGEVIGIPTETVYGLAGNALNDQAVLSIFTVKNRPTFDPLIVHIGRQEDLHLVARSLPEKARLLADRFWPGPLTLILPKQPHISDLVSSGLDTVGVRMPNHSLTLDLLHHLPFPLAAPSANPFGYISPTSAAHVDAQLGEKIKYVLDGGDCQVGLESTIVFCQENGHCSILRFGGISQEEIESVIGKVETATISSSNPKAPGMLLSHYSPRKPLLIGNIEELLAEHSHEKVAILSYSKSYAAEHQRVLTPEKNIAVAAKHLFKYLRELDALEIDFIIGEFVPDQGLGRGINDRLKRASNL